MIFDKIQSINIHEPSSWENKLFLTFDIDWANDIILNYVIDIVERHNISATWFVTHETKVLDRLRENPKFELGIHPNFNFLLNGDFRKGKNFQEVIEGMMRIVPEALSVRAHTITYSTIMMDMYAGLGLKNECSFYIDGLVNNNIKPWKHASGITHIPYIFEDDIAFLGGSFDGLEDKIMSKGIKVFDFHPFHIFANTRDYENYIELKQYFHDANKLAEHRYDGFGSYSRFKFLIKEKNK